MYLSDLVIILTVLSPVFAYFIWTLKIEGKKYYLASSILLFITTVLLSYNPVRVPKITYWLHYYTLYLLIYLLIFGYRYRYRNFNKVLAIGILTVFIAGDLWEIPIFIYDALGKTGLLDNQWSGTLFTNSWWMSHIRRLYTFAVLYLASILTGIHRNGFTKILIPYGLVMSCIILLPYAVYPGIVYDRVFATLGRIFNLGLYGYIMYVGIQDV